MAQCPSFAKKTYGGSMVPLTSMVCSTSWSTLAITSNTLSMIKWAPPIGTGFLWITQRWPSDAWGWFVERLHVGCSNPMGEALLSQLLPPRGMEYCTCPQVYRLFALLGWFGKVEATQCVGSTTSFVESWLPPPIVAAAALQHAQQQGRVHQAGGASAGPGTVEPPPCTGDFANEKNAQAQGSALCASAIGGQASPAASLDPTSMNLLAKVSELKYRWTHAVLLEAAGRSGRCAVWDEAKCRRKEKKFRRKKCK